MRYYCIQYSFFFCLQFVYLCPSLTHKSIHAHTLPISCSRWFRFCYCCVLIFCSLVALYFVFTIKCLCYYAHYRCGCKIINEQTNMYSKCTGQKTTTENLKIQAIYMLISQLENCFRFHVFVCVRRPTAFTFIILYSGSFASSLLRCVQKVEYNLKMIIQYKLHKRLIFFFLKKH